MNNPTPLIDCKARDHRACEYHGPFIRMEENAETLLRGYPSEEVVEDYFEARTEAAALNKKGLAAVVEIEQLADAPDGPRISELLAAIAEYPGGRVEFANDLSEGQYLQAGTTVDLGESIGAARYITVIGGEDQGSELKLIFTISGRRGTYCLIGYYNSWDGSDWGSYDEHDPDSLYKVEFKETERPEYVKV